MLSSDILRSLLSDFHPADIEWTWIRDRVVAPWLVGPLTRIHPNYPGYDESTNVLDEDWDVLLILDACRADVFEERADLSTFDDYKRIVSVGSHSSEWIRRTFGDGTYGDIVYVSANPHTNLVAHDAFHDIMELWDTQYDAAIGAVHPSSVAEAAIAAAEQYPDKRLIVHFMQPHGPLIGADESDPFYDDDEAYWRAYGDTFELVLPYAMSVADEVTGRTVITADHGQINMGGIFHHLGLGSHVPRVRIPGLVEVPWAVLDDERRTVSEGATSTGTQENVEDRLRDLGYKM